MVPCSSPGDAERQREEHVDQKAVEVKGLFVSLHTIQNMYIFLLLFHF